MTEKEAVAAMAELIKQMSEIVNRTLKQVELLEARVKKLEKVPRGTNVVPLMNLDQVRDGVEL